MRTVTVKNVRVQVRRLAMRKCALLWREACKRKDWLKAAMALSNAVYWREGAAMMHRQDVADYVGRYIVKGGAK